MDDVERRAVRWLFSWDTGVSSRALCSFFLTGEASEWPGAPYDSGDFGRCYRLLQRVPEWRPRIAEVAKLGREWQALVPIWDKLEALYEKNENDKVSRMIREALTRKATQPESEG